MLRLQFSIGTDIAFFNQIVFGFYNEKKHKKLLRSQHTDNIQQFFFLPFSFFKIKKKHMFRRMF